MLSKWTQGGLYLPLTQVRLFVSTVRYPSRPSKAREWFSLLPLLLPRSPPSSPVGGPGNQEDQGRRLPRPLEPQGPPSETEMESLGPSPPPPMGWRGPPEESELPRTRTSRERIAAFQGPGCPAPSWGPRPTPNGWGSSPGGGKRHPELGPAANGSLPSQLQAPQPPTGEPHRPPRTGRRTRRWIKIPSHGTSRERIAAFPRTEHQDPQPGPQPPRDGRCGTSPRKEAGIPREGPGVHGAAVVPPDPRGVPAPASVCSRPDRLRPNDADWWRPSDTVCPACCGKSSVALRRAGGSEKSLAGAWWNWSPGSSVCPGTGSGSSSGPDCVLIFSTGLGILQ